MNHLDQNQPEFFQALKHLDNNAWDILVDCCQERLLKDIIYSLHRRSLDGGYAHDLASETWMHAIENIEQLEWHDLETMYHWLRVIAYNRVRNLSRKKQSSMSLQDLEETEECGSSVLLDAFLWEHNSFGASPELELELATQRNVMEGALQILAPRDREICLRRYLDSHSRIQLAKDYDLKPYSVSRQLGRARKRLKKYLVNSDLLS